MGAAVDAVTHLHGAGGAGGAQQRRACLRSSQHLSFSCLEGQESPWAWKHPERSGQGSHTPGSTPSQAPCPGITPTCPAVAPTHPGRAGAGGVPAPWKLMQCWGPESIVSAVGTASPARTVSADSVPLCMPQRSCPTLTSCQPPVPTSKVVAPAKAQAQPHRATALPGGCTGTCIPQPQPRGAWVLAAARSPPPPGYQDARCPPMALTAALLVGAIGARLGKVAGQFCADAAPAVAGHLLSRAGAGTRPAWQRGQRLL